jgi:hypothetical protein
MRRENNILINPALDADSEVARLVRNKDKFIDYLLARNLIMQFSIQEM